MTDSNNLEFSVYTTDYPTPTVHKPRLQDEFERSLSEGTAMATDGCIVEPDGVCPHGHPSWLLREGLM